MTAVAFPHHSNMDLSRNDDYMDLASSPAMPTEDIEFDLDDIPGLSMEPNQDLMLHDEPEEPISAADAVRSSVSHKDVDDDLMIDEEALTQNKDQIQLRDLSMDNRQDTHVQLDDEDDILYEDEDDLQEQGTLSKESLEEQQAKNAVSKDTPQVVPEIQISDDFEDELQMEAELEATANGGETGIPDTNIISAQLQSDSVLTPTDDYEEAVVSTQIGTNTALEQSSLSRYVEETAENDTQEQKASEGDEPARIVVNDTEILDTEDNATDVRQQDANNSNIVPNTSLNRAVVSASPSHAQDSIDSALEERNGSSTAHYPVPHTVKVHYLDTEMCLFPPSEYDDLEMFFLQDVSLAHETLDKMLGACRDVLADTIGEDDELVLDIASLGLHISEGSRYASQITLSQIIDVYAALAHNENVTNVEPLYCSLSSRVCLASQYAYLQSAVSEGKTLTRISEENMFVVEEAERRDGLEDGKTQMHDQDVALDSKEAGEVFSDDKEEAASAISGWEQAVDTVDIANGGNHHQPGNTSPEADTGRTADNNDIDSSKVEPARSKQSTTSTVRGDPDDTEGDYDVFLDLCFKPDTCSCSSCANVNADKTTAALDIHESAEDAEDMFGDAAWNGNGTGPADANAARRSDDVVEPQLQSRLQESESSHTLESEESQLEEDLFSQDNGQAFHGRNDLHAVIQHDEEVFELEQQDDLNIGLEMDDGLLDEPEYQNDRGDIRQEPDMPSLGSSNEEAARDQSFDTNNDGAYAEEDDDLLNFNHAEELQGEGESDRPVSSPSHQPRIAGDKSAASTSTSNGTIGVHEVTTTAYNDDDQSNDNFSSATLEPRPIQSPRGQLTDDLSTDTGEKLPPTPSSSKNGSKRKALEDEDEFDLFDTATPDKKRRRPS